ncbi:hypothetical protein HK097_008747 [Rhizophlyctis rosea]|uniref:Uncharacterized protein n=1 Tax=Rhizophlyctis rosea TaxID=64517 RepID=A0AAD5SD65_9FUNG|nr:hypothetical protein HK097_008747 [Rhizophlyctis rosea]
MAISPPILTQTSPLLPKPSIPRDPSIHCPRHHRQPRFESYLTLQRCCNPARANKPRSILKKPLQQAQSQLALKDRGHFVLKTSHIRHNPIYISSLTLQKFVTIFRSSVLHRDRDNKFQTLHQILIKYIDHHEEPFGNVLMEPYARTRLHCEAYYIRAAGVLETYETSLNIGRLKYSLEYKLCKDEELQEDGNKTRERLGSYEYMLYDRWYDGGIGVVRAFFSSRSGDCHVLTSNDLPCHLPK